METKKFERELIKSILENKGAVKESDFTGKNEKRLASALLHPESSGTVVQIKDCGCSSNGIHKCEAACLFDAIKRDENNNVVISGDCVGCGACVSACDENALIGRKDSIAVLNLLKDRTKPVFALVAPAFIKQFGDGVTPGKLRCALKSMGFYGMLEVALFADILTLKEALEFDEHIKSKNDFLLTSCCCPMWVAMIKKLYSELIPHVPPSVSPMVACGRTIKKIHEGTEIKTVFIGPCLAKKAEAREADIADAVDYVLTFEELNELFALLKINPADMKEDERDHSSKSGRIYARAEGVSTAVKETLDRLRPERNIPLRAVHADGIPACKALLKDLTDGKIDANFIEGMGCVGGCVGGPRVLIDKQNGRNAVNEYGDSAPFNTPADNPFVLDLLKLLNFDTVESLLERDNFFTRSFVKPENREPK